MEEEKKVLSGLLCHIGKTLIGKNVCKKCPYFQGETGKCHGNLAFDALSYIFANEYSKHLLDGLADMQEVTTKLYSLSENVMEDIRSGKGLKPIKRPPPLR